MSKMFLNEFEAFAIDADISEYSAAQYKSYLRNVCKKLPCVTNHLDLIATSDNACDKAIYAEQMNAAVTLALKDDACPVSKKRLRDYKCAVAMLVAFVSDLDWNKGKGATAKPVLACASEYSKKDLRRIFLSRVKTQDRLSYSYGVFVARLICKIASKHKIKPFNYLVENIKFLVGPDKNKFIRLKNVDKLTIATDGHAYIESKGKSYPVYTEVVKGGKSIGYEVANVTTMRDLSLDHDTPLYYALRSAFPDMPEYKKLSDSVKDYKDNGKKQNATNLSRDYYKNEYNNICISEKTLLEEICAFIDATQITIMLTSYNSSKNKNNP